MTWISNMNARFSPNETHLIFLKFSLWLNWICIITPWDLTFCNPVNYNYSEFSIVRMRFNTVQLSRTCLKQGKYNWINHSRTTNTLKQEKLKIIVGFDIKKVKQPWIMKRICKSLSLSVLGINGLVIVWIMSHPLVFSLKPWTHGTMLGRVALMVKVGHCVCKKAEYVVELCTDNYCNT